AVIRVYVSFSQNKKRRQACKYRIWRHMGSYEKLVKNHILYSIKINATHAKNPREQGVSLHLVIVSKLPSTRAFVRCP
ncbi:MAG: hypothetical protein FWC91_14225, partial [Defluviitaleaceae bacterium]|nr:hypothetical protein [Defluviitaleaceae bacterium]